jgi:HD superfamily phosphohydrolase
MKRKRKQRQIALHATALLDTINDAVHGPIDLRDECDCPTGPVLLKLISAPFLSRLRLIKQLSYTSHFVTSADHSRFAHALGTMHVMRLLMRTLKTAHTFNCDKLFAELSKYFPDWAIKRDKHNTEKRYQRLTQHMLLAAMLQDVGEVPSNIATGRFCCPGPEFHSALKPFQFNSQNLEDKELAGLGLIANYLSAPEQKDINAAICWTLVFSLISGQLPGGNDLPGPLKCLHHLVDGEVDADRIDYVHRDALHCLGEKVSPLGLIHSFVTVDENGPVFSNSSAVSFFFLLRARLWSSVYFAPQNRFRLSLLLTVMRGALHFANYTDRRHIYFSLFGTRTPLRMSIPEFLIFHDHQLTVGISKLDDKRKKLASQLGEKGAVAVQLLAGSLSPDYKCTWTTIKTDKATKMEKVSIPDRVFFDTFSDYTAVKSFCKQKVRVQAPEFRLSKHSTVFLENAGGPFLPWFEKEPCPAPMPAPYSVLAYSPSTVTAEIRKFRKKCRTVPNSVIAQSLEENPFVPFGWHDTRKVKEFFGPDIFVSFCWEDILAVRRVLIELYQLKRKYYSIAAENQGVGNSAQENSKRAAQKAGAVIFIVSKKYCEHLKVANSPLEAEMNVLKRRYAKEGSNLKCAVLAVCHYRDVKYEFPYKDVCDDPAHFPYTGTALSRATGTEVNEIVRSTLKFIDGKEL